MAQVRIDYVCDICESRKAKYEAKLIYSELWLYMCPTCCEIYGSKLRYTIDNPTYIDSNK